MSYFQFLILVAKICNKPQCLNNVNISILLTCRIGRHKFQFSLLNKFNNFALAMSYFQFLILVAQVMCNKPQCLNNINISILLTCRIE